MSAPLVVWLLFACPYRNTTGVESCQQSRTPVRVFVAPGPLVVRTRESAFFIFAYASAAIAAACSCSVQV